MLGSLLGSNLIVFLPLIVLPVKMTSAPPHTLRPLLHTPYFRLPLNLYPTLVAKSTTVPTIETTLWTKISGL